MQFTSGYDIGYVLVLPKLFPKGAGTSSANDISAHGVRFTVAEFDRLVARTGRDAISGKSLVASVNYLDQKKPVGLRVSYRCQIIPK